MQEPQNGRKVQGTPNQARTQGSGRTPLPGHGGATEGEKKRCVLVSSAYEEALEQAHNLAALIWGAQQTDEPDMKDCFIDLMNVPLQELLQALKQIEEDL